MEGTKFSVYLGLKHYKKAKKTKIFHSFKLGLLASKFKYIPYSEFKPSSKKVCSSDVKHCFISILELKVMVKIGVIVMSFSNPTDHFRDTADFTVCTVCTVCT